MIRHGNEDSAPLLHVHGRRRYLDLDSTVDGRQLDLLASVERQLLPDRLWDHDAPGRINGSSHGRIIPSSLPSTALRAPPLGRVERRLDKSAAGFLEVYGDYGEIAVTSAGKTIATWARAPATRGPGGVWFNRQP
jgi:hypothetical protein